jgi:sugar O-acyltransferase (sialic acid O-acetyltransferase NeuD family)
LKDIAIIGAGGFGRETAWLIQQLGGWNLIGFFDDNTNANTGFADLKILGDIDALKNLATTTALVIAISNPVIRQQIAEKIGDEFDFPSLIHPSSSVGHPSNQIGKGVIVTDGVILTTHIYLGDFTIVNLATTIGHDCRLSKFTSIMPQCSISGNVTLGERCFVGAGARVLQSISLGNDCVVGAGAVVTKSFGTGAKLVGVPAKEVS